MKMKIKEQLLKYEFERIIIQIPGNSIFPGILQKNHYHYCRKSISLNKLYTFLSEFIGFIRKHTNNTVKINLLLPTIRRWRIKTCEECISYKQGPRKLKLINNKLKTLKYIGVTVIEIRKPVQAFFNLSKKLSIIKSSILLYKHFIGEDGVHIRNDRVSAFHEFMLQL